MTVQPNDRWDTDALREAVGSQYGGDPGDPRIDLPLPEQVRLLIEWACSAKPDHFRRTVPVRATDHDILICSALGRLVALAAERDDLEAVARELFDIFIEGGYAEPEDGPLLDRIAAALRVPQEENP